MDRRLGRRRYVAAVGLGLGGLAGCLGGPGASIRSGTSDAETSTAGDDEPSATGTTDGTASDGGLPTLAETLPLPMEPAAIRDRSVSGGPRKDGIPAIDEPSFETASEADGRLDPGDPVFGVAGDSDVRAYPQSILVHHEICNDGVDGRPVSVTYCPLTGTAMGFLRGETTFGVSGRLVNNNLIMYDRATETWWPQVLATSIPGPWNEGASTRSLVGFPVTWTTWGRWRGQYPETAVLSWETGYVRNYDVDPYGDYNPREGYYRPESPPMFGWLDGRDDRFEPKEVVVGARTPGGAVAFHKDGLRAAGTMAGATGRTEVLAVHDRALDTGYVYQNPEGLSFELRDGSVVGPDGSAYPPDGLPLTRVLALDAMWFAWSGFYPESDVHA